MQSSIVLHLPPQPGHPRNSEGSFVTLRDGRVLLAYSHYEGESWSDHASAVIAARESFDGGRTWSKEDRILVANEGECNVMSASLLRLQDDRIALLYLRKNSRRDCRPYLRCSTDEGATWSAPTLCCPASGYFVVNNDRLVQLANGRLVIMAACHPVIPPVDGENETFCQRAEVVTLLSDDEGTTWREGAHRLRAEEVESGLQEPGVIERRDGSLLGWARTSAGAQWEFASEDGGQTWTPARPSVFRAPLSPLSLKNIGTRAAPAWLAVWNDAGSREGVVAPERQFAGNTSWGRTPLAASLSLDEGRTWPVPWLLEDDPQRGFCYTAIHPVDGAVLLAYCSGGRGTAVLQELTVRRLPRP